MKTKHTSGPWENCGAGRIYTECKPGKASWKICQLADTGSEAIRDMEANAALIAAAPEMLAALKGAVDTLVGGGHQPGHPTVSGMVLRQMLAIIAKAEGRE